MREDKLERDLVQRRVGKNSRYIIAPSRPELVTVALEAPRRCVCVREREREGERERGREGERERGREGGRE